MVIDGPISVGVDIGGTKIAAGGVTSDGMILARRQRATAAEDPDEIERVVVENDANAAGWAEFRFGAGRGTNDMVMVTLGTGLGAPSSSAPVSFEVRMVSLRRSGTSGSSRTASSAAAAAAGAGSSTHPDARSRAGRGSRPSRSPGGRMRSSRWPVVTRTGSPALTSPTPRSPLDGVPGPPQPGVLLHAPVEAVRDLIARAHHDVTAARGDGRPVAVHRAEQVLLLVRLAADAGARRGELAALQVGDLDRDVLTIARAASAEVVGPTKTGRVRRLTLGATTAGLWRDSVATWRERARDAAAFGPWLFSRDADHATRLRASTLGHWFATLAVDSGHPDVTLHRLRHTVATTLVERGDLLQAQHRLGHRDASTTLRIYSHALPLTDTNAADALDQLYRTAGS